MAACDAELREVRGMPAVRKVRRSGERADLKTLHSSAMMPVRVTMGSRGSGVLGGTRSLHCP